MNIPRNECELFTQRLTLYKNWPYKNEQIKNRCFRTIFLMEFSNTKK